MIAHSIVRRKGPYYIALSITQFSGEKLQTGHKLIVEQGSSSIVAYTAEVGKLWRLVRGRARCVWHR
jgi:hypothetical protein